MGLMEYSVCALYPEFICMGQVMYLKGFRKFSNQYLVELLCRKMYRSLGLENIHLTK